MIEDYSSTSDKQQEWSGTCANGLQRGPVKIMCADGAPCTDLSISDFAMWTETGSKEWYSCRSAYGDGGFCLRDGSQSTPSYAASTTTISSIPTGYTEAPKMADDLATAFGFTLSIPIPTIPTSFFPGATPISRLAGT